MDLPPLHDDLTFLSPLSEQRADRMVRWLAAGLADGGTVLDAGCGWGELLVRVVEAAPSARGIGLDLDESRVEEGRRRATARGLADRLRFSAEPAAGAVPDEVDAIISIGASQVWGPEGDEPGPMPYAEALAGLRAGVRRGGRVVFGEGIWSRPPTPEVTAPLGGREDEMVILPELTELAVAHGFAIAAVHEASQDEWDEFESGYVAGCATWLASHSPEDPDAEQVRQVAAVQRSAYLRGYRGVLGLAYLQLVAV